MMLVSRTGRLRLRGRRIRLPVLFPSVLAMVLVAGVVLGTFGIALANPFGYPGNYAANNGTHAVYFYSSLDTDLADRPSGPWTITTRRCRASMRIEHTRTRAGMMFGWRMGTMAQPDGTQPHRARPARHMVDPARTRGASRVLSSTTEATPRHSIPRPSAGGSRVMNSGIRWDCFTTPTRSTPAWPRIH